MKNDSKKHSGAEEQFGSVEKINKKEEKHPVQANKGKEDGSYEEETLMDAVGSSLEETERLKGRDLKKTKE